MAIASIFTNQINKLDKVDLKKIGYMCTGQMQGITLLVKMGIQFGIDLWNDIRSETNELNKNLVKLRENNCFLGPALTVKIIG